MLGDILAELATKAVTALDAVGAEYAICGGVAVALSGRGRATRDLDVVAVLTDEQLFAFVEAARGLGFSHHSRADRHHLDDVVLYRFWLPVRDTGLSTSLDLQCGHSEFHSNVARRAQEVRVAGTRLKVASLEDLILMKLMAFRPVDRADAIDIVALNRGQVDEAYLQDWARRLGVVDRLREVLEAS